MNTQHPLKLSELDFNNISYDNIKSNESKTIIYLKYNKNDSNNTLVFQAPTLLNVNKPIENNNIFELEIPLVSKSKDRILLLKKKINELEEKIISDSRIYSKKWFNNFQFKNKINFQKIIRESKNNKYPDGVLRLKLINSNDFNTILKINNSKNINIDQIPKESSWVKSIIEVYAIWVNKNGFGLFIRPIVMSFSSIKSIKYDFNNSDDEIEDYIDDTTDIFIKQEPSESSEETEFINKEDCNSSTSS
jgi:hypothetical protein